VILALDQGDPDLEDLAHESLTVRAAADPITFDAAQHLVSAAIGEPRGGDQPAGLRGLRGKLARLLDTVSGPAPE
jgi:hypothetical protein